MIIMNNINIKKVHNAPNWEDALAYDTTNANTHHDLYLYIYITMMYVGEEEEEMIILISRYCIDEIEQ